MALVNRSQLSWSGWRSGGGRVRRGCFSGQMRGRWRSSEAGPHRQSLTRRRDLNSSQKSAQNSPNLDDPRFWNLNTRGGSSDSPGGVESQARKGLGYSWNHLGREGDAYPTRSALLPPNSFPRNPAREGPQESPSFVLCFCGALQSSPESQSFTSVP